MAPVERRGSTFAGARRRRWPRRRARWCARRTAPSATRERRRSAPRPSRRSSRGRGDARCPGAIVALASSPREDAQREEPVHQRSALVPARRMHDEPGGLSMTRSASSCVKDAEVDAALGDGRGRLRRLGLDDDRRAFAELVLAPAARGRPPSPARARSSAGAWPAKARHAASASSSGEEAIEPSCPPPLWGPGALPELRLDVPLGLDEDVDERPVVKVPRVELGRHAALVERAALFDLLGEGVEEVVVRMPFTILSSL